MNDAPSVECEVVMAEPDLPGFRLDRIEVLNWGTFDRQIWIMPLSGQSGLLTGEIGSGKSTLVDAVTALLVPSHKANFNKAAGATAKERTLRSYVLGYYKSERGEGTVARPVAVRTGSDYSVILGVFRNAAKGQDITLAQVFWIKDATGQPERLYAVGEGDLSIKGEFTGFNADLGELRKRLRRAHGMELFDSYPPYGAWFRRRLGISEQALELFHQAVSMKTVENLTDFVRAHMLEPFNTAPHIEALLNHVDDLDRAHENVLAAQRRQAMLEPLIENCDKYDDLERRVAGFTELREALRPSFAEIKYGLLIKRIEERTLEHTRKNALVVRLKEELEALRAGVVQLKVDIAQNGGDRLEELAREISRLEKERDIRAGRCEKYDAAAVAVDLLPAKALDIFIAQRERLMLLKEESEDRQGALQNDEVEIGVTIAGLRKEHKKIQEDLASLRSRKSSIDREQITIRQELCSALRLEERDMPFAGELIRVNEAHVSWEGAIERHARSFGLSLLVPDAYYARVAEWVDRTHLRGRLVYLHVRASGGRPSATVHEDSLAAKLDLHPDSAFYDWLESETARRYGDMICCDTQDRFRRESRAITRAGQIKSRERHEKDDRSAVGDRSRYVLGWTNHDKIAAMDSLRLEKEAEIQRLADQVSVIQRDKAKVTARVTHLGTLMVFENYQDLDWQSLVSEIDGLLREKSDLEASSDKLATLRDKLVALETEVDEKDERAGKEADALADIRAKKDVAQTELEATEKLRDIVRAEAVKDALRAVMDEVLGERVAQLTVERCANAEGDVRDELQRWIDNEKRSQGHINDKIVAAMKEYHGAFPLDAREADDSVRSAGEFRELLKKLVEDDLPRYERKFKELLNEQTLAEVAQFNGQLKRERETIKERVDEINRSLRTIDYNPGRYIRLEAQPTENREVREFQQELRACTDDSLTDTAGDPFSEARFLQVKDIVRRFRGREGATDEDRKWTALVTDVRNWFTFAACEHLRETDEELDILPDTDGKSGGQKEKLAYTILAASLAYQLGLSGGERQGHAFRFVAIDEAFGRGSDESAQYGLELFTRLGLQLLIATPLQKIHIIEPYVSTLGFVQNEGGKQSRLRVLSIEEYQAEKAKGHS